MLRLRDLATSVNRGGFEILSPQVAETPSSLALDIPQYGLTTLASCRWITAGERLRLLRPQTTAPTRRF